MTRLANRVDHTRRSGLSLNSQEDPSLIVNLLRSLARLKCGEANTMQTDVDPGVDIKHECGRYERSSA